MRHRDGIAILEVQGGADAKLATFAVRLAATEARSAPRIDTGRAQWRAAGVDECARRSLHLGPRAVCRSPGAAGGGRPAAASGYLLKVDPEARLAILAGDAGDEPEAVARRLIDSQLQTVGTEVAVVAWRSSGLIQPALRRLAPIAPLLAGDLTALDAAAAGLALSVAGVDVTAPTLHRLLFDNQTFATYLAYWGQASQTPLDVTLTLPVEGVPVVYAPGRRDRACPRRTTRGMPRPAACECAVPADRAGRCSSISTKGRRRVRRAEWRHRRAPVVGGGDHRPAPAAAARAGRAGAQLHRPRADGAAFPSHDDRSRL